MNHQFAENLERGSEPKMFKWLVTIASLLVLTNAFLVFYGWIYEVKHIVQWSSETSPMQPNTAICMALLSLLSLSHLYLKKDKLHRLLSLGVPLFVFFIGASTMMGYISNLDLGIDQLFIEAKDPSNPFPGRPAPLTSLLLTLMSSAAFLRNFNVAWIRWSSQLIYIVSGLLSTLILVAHTYGTSISLGFPLLDPYNIVATQTALSFLLLIFCFVTLDLKSGPFSHILAKTSGAVVAKYVLIAEVLVPLTIAFLLRAGEEAGLYDISIQASLSTFFVMVIMGTYVLLISKKLHYQSLEKERVETEYKKVAEKNKVLLKIAPVAIFSCDHQGQITYANNQAELTFEISSEEMIRKNISELIPGLRLEDHKISSKIQSGQIMQARKKSGEHFPVELFYSPLGDGLDWLMIFIVQDVSKRMKLESQLRENEQKLIKVLDSLPVGVWFTDPQGKIVKGNKVGVETWGAARYVSIEEYGEFKGWWAQSGKRIAPLEWALARALKEGRSFLDEIIEIETFDGSYKFIRNSAVPIHGEEGDTLGALVVNEDITEQYRGQNERELLEKLGGTLVGALDVDYILKSACLCLVPKFADWCAAYRLQESGEFVPVFAHHKSSDSIPILWELINKNPSLKEPTETTKRALREQRPVLMTEISPEYLFNLSQTNHQLNLSQTLSPRSFIVVPLALRGKVYGIIYLLRGYKESHRDFDGRDTSFAAELGQRISMAIESCALYQQVQRSVKFREEILSIVAHDLRNPLSTISLATSAIEEDLASGEKVSQSLKKYLPIIRDNSTQMTKLIQELMDFSRIEAGRLSLEMQNVLAQDIVKEILSLFQLSAKRKRIDLEIIVLPEDLKVYCDQERVVQALANLMSNSLKFTSSEGWIRLKITDHVDHVEMSVADSGIGIPKDQIEFVFQKFWQRVGNEKNKWGLGLGLSIVKGIVEAHHGTIVVDSDEGKGTTFTLILPKQGLKSKEMSVKMA